MISHGTPPRRLWHRRQANLLPNDRFPAVSSLRPAAGLGRQRPFAGSGSSRWPGLVAESLNRLRAPPPPKVRFRGYSGQPPAEPSNVGYRRPPTLAGQIRTAADRLEAAVHPERRHAQSAPWSPLIEAAGWCRAGPRRTARTLTVDRATRLPANANCRRAAPNRSKWYAAGPQAVYPSVYPWRPRKPNGLAP
jgi:hypothetical protein